MTSTKVGPKISRRTLLAGGAALGTAAIVGTPSIVRAQAKTLTIAGPSEMGPILEQTCFADFEARFGAKVLFDGGNSLDNLRKIQTQKDRPVISLVLMDDPAVMQAHALGLVDPLNANVIKNLTQLAPAAVIKDGVWANYKWQRTSIGYNPKINPAGPESWASLWDDKLKGKVALPAPSTSSISVMLAVAAALETGKPPAQALYDLDAAFRKLKALKPNIMMFFGNVAQAVQLIETGEISFACCMLSSLVIPRKRNGSPLELGRPKDGSYALQNGIAKIKNGPAAELADAFINEMLGAKYQAAVSERTADTPTNVSVPIAGDIVSAKELITLDWGFIGEKRDIWMERMQREIAA